MAAKRRRRMTPLQALEKAIEIHEGQTALANAIGVSQQKVYAWLNVTGQASPEDCVKIEKATEGKVLRQELRPDVFVDA